MGGTGMAVINRWQKDVKMKMMQWKVQGKTKMAQPSHNPSANARGLGVDENKETHQGKEPFHRVGLSKVKHEENVTDYPIIIMVISTKLLDIYHSTKAVPVKLSRNKQTCV